MWSRTGAGAAPARRTAPRSASPPPGIRAARATRATGAPAPNGRGPCRRWQARVVHTAKMLAGAPVRCESTGVPLLVVFLLMALGCGHAQSTPAAAPSGGGVVQASAPARSNGGDAAATAAQLSEETRSLLVAEGELLWQRWTTGSGPLPASALAEHPRLLQRKSIDVVSVAADRASTSDARGALSLLAQQLSTFALAREAAAEIEALERARAQLAFAPPGESRATFGERDLDRLLTEEPDAQKRASLGVVEARAAEPLAPLAMARDAAVEKALHRLGLGTWASLEERAHGMSLGDLS